MRNLGGHRASYQDLFAQIFTLAPSVGKIGAKDLRKLFAAERLLFGSLDDDCFGFFIVAMSRAISGRKTAGLLMRPQSCFRTGPKSLVKQVAFRFLKRVKKITVCTIVPFSVAPDYERIADVGLQDPQLWDAAYLSAKSCAKLAEVVRQKAHGRIVLSFLGAANQAKGISFLIDIISSEDFDWGRYFIVVAGNLKALDSDTTRRLSSAGALLIPRDITDDELNALYNVSGLVWACYHPSYDQASGIFGRAVQHGKIAVLRRFSVIHRIAWENDTGFVELDYGDISGAVQTLSLLSRSFGKRSSSGSCGVLEKTERWREEFLFHISQSL